MSEMPRDETWGDSTGYRQQMAVKLGIVGEKAEAAAKTAAENRAAIGEMQSGMQALALEFRSGKAWLKGAFWMLSAGVATLLGFVGFLVVHADSLKKLFS